MKFKKLLKKNPFIYPYLSMLKLNLKSVFEEENLNDLVLFSAVFSLLVTSFLVLPLFWLVWMSSGDLLLLAPSCSGIMWKLNLKESSPVVKNADFLKNVALGLSGTSDIFILLATVTKKQKKNVTAWNLFSFAFI